MSRLFIDTIPGTVDIILIHHELLNVEIMWLGILYYTMEGKSPLQIDFL